MEKDFEGRCVQYAKDDGWYVRKVKAEGVNGFPDRLFIKEGVVILIEFKDPNGNYSVSKIQRAEMRKIRRAGIEAYVCDDWGQFKEILARGLTREQLVQARQN